MERPRPRECVKRKHVLNSRLEDDCFRTFALLRASRSAMNSVRVRLRFDEVASNAVPFEDASVVLVWSPSDFNGQGESVVD